MQKKYKRNLKPLSLGLVLLSPIALIGGIKLSSVSSNADTITLSDYSESINITNSSFTEGANPYASGNVTGWKIIQTESKATGMIIDVGQTFSTYQQHTYLLDQNPVAIGTNKDDNKILMINSKDKDDATDNLAKKGYRSNAISLKSNSYYKFSVKAKTALNGSHASVAKGSIYINGLKDSEGKDVKLAQEEFTNTSWATYYFYLATGDEPQEITIDLYLGSETGYSDGGVVFFDDVTLEQFAQNTFYRNINEMKLTTNKNVVYNLDSLVSKKSNIDMSGYNFDFENKIEGTISSALGEEWKAITTGTDAKYGHAKIISVERGTQGSQFQQETGYDFVGNDLSYNATTEKENTQALVLYSTKNRKTSYGVKSKDIEIKAHGFYKLSMYVKVSQMDEGNFYVKVRENNAIYNSGVSEDKYTLAVGNSEGISSNKTDNFHNNYQKVDFYIRGHQLYDTSVNLEFWLGSDENPASGCVFIDNITLSHVKFEEFDSATNKLALSTYSSSPTFNNGYFNETENENAELAYPLKASGWTLEQNDNKNLKQQAGIVYLKNEAKYDEMYKDKYDWYGMYPNTPNGVDAPNNVYMLFNQNASYQNLTSDSYTLEKGKYYKLTFDYWTSPLYTSKDASLTIEVVDDNGITLFKQSGFESETMWSKGEIYFHTAEQTSNNVKIKIHFGENENNKLVQGIAYLDNFEIQADIAKEEFDAGKYSVDLTDYLLNLDPKEEIGKDISSSTAYQFTTDNIDNSIGGIIRGKDNVFTEDYGVEVEDSNILVLSTFAPSKANLKSNYKFSVEASSYYKLTFDLRTIFPHGIENDFTTDDHKECKYGVSIGLSDFKLIEGLKSEDKFTTYTIYFKADSSTTPQLDFSLICDCENTNGNAFLTHLNFTSATQDEYTSAKNSDNFEKTIFTTTELDKTDDNEDDDTNSGNEVETSPENSVWLLIPSIIFAVAIVIGIAGWALRKINIKKAEKVREEAYDRKISVNHDMVLREAQRLRDEEVKALKDTKANLEQQKTELENAHKQDIKNSRLSSKGKITKETERTFKTYASTMSRLNEKLAILDEQITHAISTDHLLELQNKVEMDEEKRLKNEMKMARELAKYNKEQDKN